MTNQPNESSSSRSYRRTFGSIIFLSRWLQAPLYLGLIVAQGVYVWRFMVELAHLVSHSGGKISEAEIMLLVLGLVDVVMIANLLIMVIVGGYETFVSRLHLEGHPDQPEWLSHVNAGVLKVKLAAALIGISSIHLLKTFIGIGLSESSGANLKLVTLPKLTDYEIMWQVIIHVVFLFSALALAYIDRMVAQPSHKQRAGQG